MALIGLKGQIAPQLQPDLRAYVIENSRPEPALGKHLRDTLNPLGVTTIELPHRKPIAFNVADDPGLGHDRGRIGDATDDAPRIKPLKENAAGVDGSDHAICVLAAKLLEVPPRDAVLQRHHDRLWAQQRVQLIDDGLDLMGLERQEHDVVRAQFSNGVGRAGRRDGCLPVCLDQGQATLADCSKMGAPGNHGHIMPRVSQTDGHVAANGTGADDTDPHVTRLTPPNNVTLNTRAMMTMKVNAENTTRLVQLAQRTTVDG